MSQQLQSLTNYALVICEKPEAARRMAEALGDENFSSLKIDGVEIFSARTKNRNYVICSALGHLYTVEDPSKRRHAYPVFDLDWFPISAFRTDSSHIARRIEVIKKLAQSAKVFVHSCDFDLEGETIGYNILKYACGGKESEALRARFSTLTREELRHAVAQAKPGLGTKLAEAGRTRHVVDFVWGVNLSRALSEALYSANNSYRTITIGRVQGPTLAYVVEREIEIRTFVPVPYWKITAILETRDKRFEASYERDRVDTHQQAQSVKEACEGKTGVVERIRKTPIMQSPPPPFNLGDLQREAFRVFGFSPSQTLSIAEKLYLEALISYPRTSSQKLPPSIDYRRILSGLQSIQGYADSAKEILRGDLVPRQGDKEDPAHPAIYPTGEKPSRALEPREVKLFDIIVRRFFSVFAKDAILERVTAQILVNNHIFKIFGRRTLEEGWLKYYGVYSRREDSPLPRLFEGDEVLAIRVNTYEKFEQPPSRYNQSSLLEKMENEGIGTKATRAEIISTLYQRGYIAGEAISATDMGFAVSEAMKQYSPEILSLELTKSVERDLERIENGQVDGEFVSEQAVELLKESLAKIKIAELAVGDGLRQALIRTIRGQNLLGPCPVCRVGKLTIIRSRSTGKRFVGCTSYANGCRASAPLPQIGSLRTTSTRCRTCGWPIIYVRRSRIPWRLCVNPQCPSKRVRKT